jgi:uncharacterized membrane protein YeiH
VQYLFIIEVLGTIAFTISGALAAIEKKLDLFGVLTLGFVTAIGGGTIRDVLIGNTPVSWMRDLNTPLIILGAGLFTIVFGRYLQKLRTTLFLFDTLGLALFTVVGMKKGLDLELNAGICIALGTITGCFGGVLRDVLMGKIPALFHTREIYATACIAGGMVYIAALRFMPSQAAESIAIVVISTIRLLAVRYDWKLPMAKPL